MKLKELRKIEEEATHRVEFSIRGCTLYDSNVKNKLIERITITDHFKAFTLQTSNCEVSSDSSDEVSYEEDEDSDCEEDNDCCELLACSISLAETSSVRLVRLPCFDELS